MVLFVSWTGVVTESRRHISYIGHIANLSHPPPPHQFTDSPRVPVIVYRCILLAPPTVRLLIIVHFLHVQVYLWWPVTATS